MKLALSTFFMLAAFTALQAQPFGDKKMAEPSTVVWYGLDFSAVKLIGSEGFSDPYDIKNRFFRAWNRLIVDEADKYNIKKTFRKTGLEYETTVVEERNKLPNENELVTENDYSLKEDDVKKIVKKYKSDKFKEGLGLVFVMESFNKRAQSGHMWVTFFDIASGEVILTRRYSGDARGFGLRNYWAGSVYDVFEQLESDYGKWQKKNN
jgi:hypothetical protein